VLVGPLLPLGGLDGPWHAAGRFAAVGSRLRSQLPPEDRTAELPRLARAADAAIVRDSAARRRAISVAPFIGTAAAIFTAMTAAGNERRRLCCRPRPLY
jgi:hypothetical protein